jgi:hypothetical protein
LPWQSYAVSTKPRECSIATRPNAAIPNVQSRRLLSPVTARGGRPLRDSSLSNADNLVLNLSNPDAGARPDSAPSQVGATLPIAHLSRHSGTRPPYPRGFLVRSTFPTVAIVGLPRAVAPAAPVSRYVLPLRASSISLFCGLGISFSCASAAGSMPLLTCCDPAAMLACFTNVACRGNFRSTSADMVARLWAWAFNAMLMNDSQYRCCV